MKRVVVSFSVQVIGNNVRLDIQTDRKNPYKYAIWMDDRHSDIFSTAKHLNDGLKMALENSIKIDIDEYKERLYLTIELPIPYHSNQYSARVIEE